MINCVKKKWDEFPLEMKVSASFIICSIIQRCINFFTIPFFARILSQEEYGQVTIYYAWTSVIAIFTTLQLPQGTFSKAMVKYEDKRNEYISSAQTICLLLSFLFIAIYIPFFRFWNLLFELPFYIVILMILDILSCAGFAFWSGKKKFEYKYKGIIIFTLTSSIVSVLTQFILVLNLENKGIALILGSALVNLFFSGSILLFNFFKGKTFFNKEFWKFSLGFNIPLILYYLSQMLFNTSDRIMISHLEGHDKAAIYNVAYTLAVSANFVLTAIYNSYIPWIYNKIKVNKQCENREVSFAISVFLACILFVIILFAPEFVLIMGGRKYLEAKWIVAPVSMSILLLFYSQLSISFEFYFEEKNHLIFSSVFSALLNIVLNAIFIPIFGYIVAGYTTFISYLVFSFCNYISLKIVIKKHNIKDEGFDIYKLGFLFIIFMILGYLCMVIYDFLVVRIIIFLIICLNAVINRKKFFYYLKKIRK